MCLSNTNLSVGVAFFVSVFFHTKRKCSEITISFIFGSYERVFDSGIRCQAVRAIYKSPAKLAQYKNRHAERSEEAFKAQRNPPRFFVTSFLRMTLLYLLVHF